MDASRAQFQHRGLSPELAGSAPDNHNTRSGKSTPSLLSSDAAATGAMGVRCRKCVSPQLILGFVRFDHEEDRCRRKVQCISRQVLGHGDWGGTLAVAAVFVAHSWNAALQ